MKSCKKPELQRRGRSRICVTRYSTALHGVSPCVVAENRSSSPPEAAPWRACRPGWWARASAGCTPPSRSSSTGSSRRATADHRPRPGRRGGQGHVHLRGGSGRARGRGGRGGAQLQGRAGQADARAGAGGHAQAGGRSRLPDRRRPGGAKPPRPAPGRDRRHVQPPQGRAAPPAAERPRRPAAAWQRGNAAEEGARGSRRSPRRAAGLRRDAALGRRA